jgi:alpha-ketoglutaric semialdehyde dehydrogenase
VTDLHGGNLIAGAVSTLGETRFRAADAASGKPLDPAFHEATDDEIDRALTAAAAAFPGYRARSAEEIAGLLEEIAAGLEGLGDALIQRARSETALPEARLVGERGRTCAQLRMFAELVREGSWVDARIDRALPDRKPAPRPDLRRMLVPIGPVVVFGASNFPLAFSVCGGDTASALAAGNPVVVKGHPAHPGTSEMAARVVAAAVEKRAMPAGVFSMVQGPSPRVGLALVRHPGTRAVGFTGSLQGGRALFDAAAARADPIPVFAEMGSINPVFVLPGALAARAAEIAEAFVQSVTLGVGQFCTNPGLAVALAGRGLELFVAETSKRIGVCPPGTMLSAPIARRYEEGLAARRAVEGVRVAGEAAGGGAVILATDARRFLEDARLHEELFGPSSLVVACPSREELYEVARRLAGQLTVTLHATAQDVAEHRALVDLLRDKAGRLIANGFPTGVEVSPAMQHGGPYPATTDPRFTSVGTAAIFRFARPVCYQNFPPEWLPPELQDGNPRGIWRTVDGQRVRDP